jgi:ATP-dependent 26S proteasome regulatory subunit
MWQTIFLPVVGLVDPDKLKPGDLVGVNKDSYLILDTLPSEYDSRVKAMEVDEKPTEDYNDIGGLEKQVLSRHGLGSIDFMRSPPVQFSVILNRCFHLNMNM